MTERVSIEQAFERPEFDLWGSVFVLRMMTRSIAEKWDKTSAAVQTAETNDEAMLALGEQLDVVLEPSSKGQAKASTQIRKKWEADELTLQHLKWFCERVGEVAFERPT